MKGRSAQWRDALRTQLWPLPVVAVVLAVVAGTALPALDAAVDGQMPRSVAGLLFSGGPEAARSVLQAISGSLITVTSLTFSLTVVTLQLASSQFSPRLLRTFTSDRFVHVTLALFLAAFAFALTILRSVRVESSRTTLFVPEISVTVAFGLALASVLALVLFLAHLTREIRVETMLQRVDLETRQSIDRVFARDRPARMPEPKPDGEMLRIESTRSGFLTSLEKTLLLDAATSAGAVIRIDHEPGSSLIEGVPFATAWPVVPGTVFTPTAREELQDRVNASVGTGAERTNVQDVGFGFRQLADVAARALSPGINDPTTAVHVIGHLSALLCQLAQRNLGPEYLIDVTGNIRVVLSLPGMGELLGMAMNQPRQYGAADPAVATRLLALLQELSWCDRNGMHRVEILEHRDRMLETIADGNYLAKERKQLLDLANAVGATAPPR